MAQSRLDLQALLLTMCPNVYFDPPESIKMVYPCIIYNRYRIKIEHADNAPYKHDTRYQVTVVDRNPDSDIVDKVKQIPKIFYDRFYSVDDLTHDVFTLFF